MAFVSTVLVRFGDVDAAAIVFYPRYFEMLNGAVEDWFAQMGFDFHRMHTELRIGIPTVKLTSEFLAPSHLGEKLAIEIAPHPPGRSSCAFDFRFSGDDRDRLRGSAVLVCMNLTTQASMPWPEELRSRLVAAGV